MRRTKSKPIALSVIVPVYNEEERVHNLAQLCMFLAGKKYIRECIVVNDGSIDRTLTLLHALQKKYRFHLISYKKNRGKGYAIKKGIEQAKGSHVVFVDVDLSTDLSAFDHLLKMLPHAHIVIGTRKNKHAELVERQSLLRESMGRFFTFLSQIISGVFVSDFTCGFKCFERTIAGKIARKQRIYGWAYDVEYLYLGKKMGSKIAELPVKWKNDQRTKVRFPQDIITSLRDICLIRLQDVGGLYRR